MISWFKAGNYHLKYKLEIFITTYLVKKLKNKKPEPALDNYPTTTGRTSSVQINHFLSLLQEKTLVRLRCSCVYGEWYNFRVLASSLSIQLSRWASFKSYTPMERLSDWFRSPGFTPNQLVNLGKSLKQLTVPNVLLVYSIIWSWQ